LLYFFVWRDGQNRYKQTCRVLWVVLQPLLTHGRFYDFFGRLARLPSEGLPYPVFYFAALVPWAYFATSLALAPPFWSLTSMSSPRYIFPAGLALRCGSTGLIDMAIGLVVMTIITLAYGFRPGWTLLLIPFLCCWRSMTALAIGLWTSALNALYRDMGRDRPLRHPVSDAGFSGRYFQQPGTPEVAALCITSIPWPM